MSCSYAIHKRRGDHGRVVHLQVADGQRREIPQVAGPELPRPQGKLTDMGWGMIEPQPLPPQPWCPDKQPKKPDPKPPKKP